MLKKVLSLVISLVVLVAFCLTVSAEGEYFEMVYQSDVTEANKGESFSVTFYVNSITHEHGLLSLSADIEYISSHLKFDGAEPVTPDNWNNVFFECYEVNSGEKNILEIILFDDGSMSEEISVFEDNKLGVKLNFTVLTEAETKTSVNMPAGNALNASTGLPSLNVALGKGCNFEILLNKSETDFSTDESKIENDSSVNGDISNDSSQELTSSEETSDTSEEMSAEVSNSEDAGKEESSSSGGEAVLNESDANSQNVNDSESNEEKEEGINIIFWLCVGCALIAVVAVVVYITKNKKDDMNPVNPG